MSTPSPGSSSNIFDSIPLQGRKRQRSQSMQSDSAASTSSVKRSTADTSSADTRGRSPLIEQPPASVSPDLNQEIDSYMAASGALDTPPVSPPPSCQDIVMQLVSLEEKCQIVQKGKGRKMEVGETWYLVSRVWYKRWRKACTGEIDKEGPVTENELGSVDNSGLLDSYRNLQSPLAEGVDVEYVPQEVWDLFVQWYGSPSHPLPRAVIARGYTKQATLELYPLRLKVFRLVKSSAEGANTPHLWVTISAGESITVLCSKLLHVVAWTSEDVPYRVWKIGTNDSDGIEYLASQLSISDAKIIDASDKTLEEDGIDSDDAFVVEFKQSDGWIAEAPKAILQPAPLFNSADGFFNRMSYTFSPSSSSLPYNNIFNTSEISSSKTASVSLTLSNNNKNFTKALEPGSLGLGNMGNTCFMNSALQCLGHTKELADYFLSGVFEDEINRNNPLGMGGAIAEAFGSLLTRMWASSGPSTSYSPRDFKMQLQRFAPQFSGYQQHDSQELVAFLLDGLHEDLNRVLKKPYVEKPDWDGGDILELVKLAKKSWEGYMMRNDSIIVDLFQGQYQSTLVCPECQKVSITFDPFMYLTLPLPVQKKWKHTIFYIPWDLEKPHVKVPVVINRDASFKDLRALLGRWLGAPPENLMTLEIFSHRFYKNLDDTVSVGDMSDNDVIVCFELPCNARQSRTYKKTAHDLAILPVLFCDAKMRGYFPNRTMPALFGYPIVVVIDEEQAQDVTAMYEAIVIRLQRWTKNARDLFVWEVDSESEIDTVSVRINGYAPMETITEIREDGKVVTLESTSPPEGDIADEKRIIVDEGQDLEFMDLPLSNVGIKKDIFNLRLQVNHHDYGTSFVGYAPNTRWESWDNRIQEADEHPNLLRDHDAFYCEFDEDKKAYYFGDNYRPEHALWDQWELFLHPELEESKKAASDKRLKGISLQDCLEEFTKEEQLGEDDLWYCPRCKKHQQASKKFDLWKAPDILVVHLKRFSNNRTFRDKIDSLVNFPIEDLDLGGFVKEREAAKELLEQGIDIEDLGLGPIDEPLMYDLYAVDEHLGGLGGGHYRAYAANHLTGKWYHFDDSFISQCRASDSVNANAYVLFYRRRTNSPLGGKSQSNREGSHEPKSEAEIVNEVGSSVVGAETQLPTPPNEPTQFEIGSSNKVQSELPSHVEHLRSTDDDGAWHLRPLRSNAESSVPSPPAEDLPDYDDYHPISPGSFAIDLLRQRFSFPDPAQKASPTSSNEAEADADIDTDIDQEDRDWEEMPNLDIRGGLPDGSYSDMDKQYDWDAADTFGVQDDHFLDLTEDKTT